MKYIVEINEKTAKGKALKILLHNDEAVKISKYKRPELIEEDILVNEMNKAEKDRLISFDEGKTEFARLKKRLQA